MMETLSCHFVRGPWATTEQSSTSSCLPSSVCSFLSVLLSEDSFLMTFSSLEFVKLLGGIPLVTVTPLEHWNTEWTTWPLPVTNWRWKTVFVLRPYSVSFRTGLWIQLLLFLQSLKVPHRRCECCVMPRTCAMTKPPSSRSHDNLICPKIGRWWQSGKNPGVPWPSCWSRRCTKGHLPICWKRISEKIFSRLCSGVNKKLLKPIKFLVKHTSELIKFFDSEKLIQHWFNMEFRNKVMILGHFIFSLPHIIMRSLSSGHFLVAMNKASQFWNPFYLLLTQRGCYEWALSQAYGKNTTRMLTSSLWVRCG